MDHTYLPKVGDIFLSTYSYQNGVYVYGENFEAAIEGEVVCGYREFRGITFSPVEASPGPDGESVATRIEGEWWVMQFEVVEAEGVDCQAPVTNGGPLEGVRTG